METTVSVQGVKVPLLKVKVCCLVWVPWVILTVFWGVVLLPPLVAGTV